MKTYVATLASVTHNEESKTPVVAVRPVIFQARDNLHAIQKMTKLDSDFTEHFGVDLEDVPNISEARKAIADRLTIIDEEDQSMVSAELFTAEKVSDTESNLVKVI